MKVVMTASQGASGNGFASR
uniref:Uncharacterized protein n=1 Tax=Anguilla anguilla TaxID=7936 RepID=A0A0E9S044_ANGAN